MALVQRKYTFPRIQRGSNIFMLVSIETHITCDFPGGRVRNPYPPSGSAHVSRNGSRHDFGLALDPNCLTL